MPADDAVQLAMKLGRYAENPEASVDVKALQGAESVFRLRYGVYRAVFKLDGDQMEIQRVGHRKDVYEK